MKTKVCKDCHSRKRVSSFNPHGRRLGGYDMICRSCREVNSLRCREAQRDKMHVYDATRRLDPLRLAMMAEYQARWRADNRDKKKAHYTLGNALRAGKVKRQSCSRCGVEDAHGHHNDYSKPLEVTWLCREHHFNLHFPNPGLRT